MDRRDDIDATIAALTRWMPHQRWYATKARTPELRLVGSWQLPASGLSPQPLRITSLLVLDTAAAPPVVYQVPIVARPTRDVDAATPGYIGEAEAGTALIDGPHDAAFAGGIMQLLALGAVADGDGATARGEPSSGERLNPLDMTSVVLTGEQSNTSIVYLPAAASGHIPVICKLYRQLQAGTNPDVELQTALSQAGSRFVPQTIGAVSGRWPDRADPLGSVEGSLAFAQEFLPGVQDAWRAAQGAASGGEAFTTQARELGTATAAVHLDLARLFGTRSAALERETFAAAWRRRLRIATDEVPAIAPLRDRVDVVYAKALETDWPVLQRIHGDFHLGQVLLVPGRGWVLLDFEGEPLRPMAERTQPDLALRDIAGMLRSFDYVSGSIRLESGARDDGRADAADAWARDARGAFEEGYAEASDTDLGCLGPLLAALELDKAVYEAIYESRNRPTWTTIPLRAITRLVGG